MNPTESRHPGSNHAAAEQEAAVELLERVRTELAGLGLPLELPTAQEARTTAANALGQLDDYILPRWRSLDAPLLAVVGGSTGAGKSTLVNALVGHPVTRSGAIRPTTRQPILLHHPQDADWFTSTRVLPTLRRIQGEIVKGGTPASKAGAAPEAGAITSLVLVGDEAVPQGIAILDAPDVDSISDDNRQMAGQLLAAADLWLFVTTANRYADAVPWKLLLDAAGRDITVAVVLDRVPAGAEQEIAADLHAMLIREGLAGAQLFVVPEATLNELGMLPADSVAPIHTWLAGISEDAAGRAEIVRRTLNGTVRSLSDRLTSLAGAVQDQNDAGAQLGDDVRAAFADAGTRIGQATSDGTLLRGEVLSRWQDFVGTGEFFRAVETNIGRVRDRIGAFFKGQPPPAVKVETAIETGLQAVILDQAARAAEDADQRWRADPAGRQLLGTDDLSGTTADFPAEVAAEIRAWQGGVLALIRSEGSSKRSQARWLSFGVNGLGVALMIVVFSFTGGLTGAEVGIAGGTAVVGQKLLEAIFGEDAVRRLAKHAKDDLDQRCATLLERQQQKFLDRLAPVQADAQRLEGLAAQLADLGKGTNA
ncbi:energy-coupling factor transporter ATP-binding protein EcfA2 [Arthrobacter stackebrandtii]|uniref:Energy-coupling factor transporter ATP-binding protein EcfA2 n=1 Tax=Arthrobacter stackebrandtii TaxID=272161 RepID=A0ABS4YZY8_9MICC|nr:energy-coupling factor transporter ATP-binding protein EcfA2 [Arthrobacter stackebrandtii]PYG99020.1 ABC transporter [Arthrobacter stackebrandtii]